MSSRLNSLTFVCAMTLSAACSSDPPSFAEKESSEGTDAGGDRRANSESAGPADSDNDTDAVDASGHSVVDSRTGANPGNGVDETDMPDAMDQSQIDGVDRGARPEVPLAELGAPCARGGDCESGFCADGVCCESACSEVCSQCDGDGTAGSCVEVALDDACGQQVCPDSTECRSYELIEERNCEAIGQCAAAAPCESQDLPSATSCAGGAGVCDGAGDCVIPNKATLGEVCSTDEECGSGFCSDTAGGESVCCSERCDGVCEVCASSGYCDEAPVDDPRCETVTCMADTICADYPDALSEDRCSGFGQCVSAGAYCVAEFADASTSCGTGMLCDGAGGCSDACSVGQTWCSTYCANLMTDASNCGTCGNACPGASGTSVGYGCDQGTCRLQCPNGQVGCDGSCISPDTDPDYCGASGHCEGGSEGERCAAGEQCIVGVCRVEDGGACAAGVDCVSGTCTAWYPDEDGDTFGAPAGVVRTCGSNPPGANWVTNSLDCCDAADDPEDAADVNPNFSTGTGALGRTYGAEGCAEPFDWNCDGTVTKEMDNALPCSTFTTSETCPTGAFDEGFVPECGQSSFWFGCSWNGGQCETTQGGPFTQRCY